MASVIFNTQAPTRVLVHIPLPGSRRTHITSAQFLGKDQRKMLFPSEFLPPTFPGVGTAALPYTNSDSEPRRRARIYFFTSFLSTYSLSSSYPGDGEKFFSKVQMGEYLVCDVKKVSSPSSSISLERQALITCAQSIIWWILHFKYLLKTQKKNSTA